MDRLDAQQALAFSSEFCCAVLGNLAHGFMLVPLDGPPLAAEDVERAHERGYQFCGVLGFVNGQCVARTEPGIDAVSVCAAATRDFAALVVARTKDDWLERMWELPDTRTN